MTHLRTLFFFVCYLGWTQSLSAEFALSNIQLPPTPTFTLIADTMTPVPGGSGTFTLFGDARAISGGRVAFLGFDSGSGSGIYTFENGSLNVLVDESTSVPGTTDTFTSFFDVSLDGNVVAFTGGWPGPGGGCSFSGSEGVFGLPFLGGSPVTVADSLTTSNHCFHGVDLLSGLLGVGGGSNPVDNFHNHSEKVMATTAVGSLTTVFDLATVSPGGSTFVGYDQDFVLQNEGVLFSEILPNTVGAVAGLYYDRNDGVGPRLIADTSTAVPAGSGNFMNFAGSDADGLDVAFVGRDSSNISGVYAGTDSANLRVVVNRTTPVPGESGNFLGVSNPLAYNEGVILFSGFWSGGGFGLFAEAGGTIYSVLKKGELLDGKVVEQAYCRTQNKDGRNLLILVRFQQGFAPALYWVTY